MINDNPWELYQTKIGWKTVSNILDEAWTVAIVCYQTAKEIRTYMESILLLHKNYGAYDTEPRNHLTQKIKILFRERFGEG